MAEVKESPKMTVKKAKKANVAITGVGRAYITSTFNNTIITITNDKGDVIGWSSSGSAGYKGTRKSTPFAASSAMEIVSKKAVEKGLKTIEVYVKGPGAGRDSALRAIKTAGLAISSITDITPVPHNGPRAKKKRRI